MFHNKALIIAAAYISMIPIAVLTSAKITTLLGFNLTVGAFAYGVTFPCTDIVGETYGKSYARQLVFYGLVPYFLTIGFSLLVVAAPPASFWVSSGMERLGFNINESYKEIIGLAPRIAAASLLAYMISQLHDVWAFDFWKRKTEGRYLWLRNNLSTISSQFIDSIIFVSIAFVGLVPNGALATMILGQFLFKVMIALIDTPIVYLGVFWVTKEKTTT